MQMWIQIFIILFDLKWFMCSVNSKFISKVESYDYILPTRKVVSCPSFASFKFSCQNYHVISIDSLTFSPVLLDSSGECTSDWSAECRDEESALEYSINQCSSRESCTLISYQLRSRTKCTFHQVISIEYKCIPTWEVTAVPVKCDICKNVTINCNNDDFGFVHSTWYPKMYPRSTCHSIIQNKPDHMIVVYSVSGSVGLDRIQLQSVDMFGKLADKEILTGNMTTQLVFKSAYDVNVTVLPEDYYYAAQRRFLLYFYIVPKCYLILCPNISVYPHPTTTKLVTTSTTLLTSRTTELTTPCDTTTTIRTTTSTTTTTTRTTTTSTCSTTHSLPTTTTTKYIHEPSTYDHRIHDHRPHRISDAWIAAILALIYALLMIFGVVIAIYCRRKKRRVVQERKIILSPSVIASTSQIINSSRTDSSFSLREQTKTIMPLKNAYNLPFNSIYLTGNMNNLSADDFHKDQISIRQQSNYAAITPNDFDHYSQVMTETEDNFSNLCEQKEHFSESINYKYSNEVSYPYIVRATVHDSHSISPYNNPDSLRSIYRAVEYTKSPDGERVRVKNSEDYINESNSIKLKTVRTSSLTEEIQTKNMILDEENEKTFIVKLFPMDDQQREVQEMSLHCT